MYENKLPIKYFLRPYVLFLYAAFLCFAPMNAQNNPVVNYLQQTGDYAEIYNGKLESVYNTLIYENFPYYTNADFVDATVVYRNNYYPDQKARLDLYAEQLILLPPDKRFGVIVSSKNVQKVVMYNKSFVWLTPSKDSGLKQGYYIQLYEGRKIQLFCKQYYSLQQQQGKITYYFELKTRYYLFYNSKYYSVKNKGVFNKLFPQVKKQINQFVKNSHLNFKQNTDESLTLLAGHCEELITSTNKQ